MARIVRTLDVISSPQDSHALENTMVGFYQCLNDQYFTILQANRGFTALLEYSREEIAQKFNNRFLELLQPDEGQQVMANSSRKFPGKIRRNWNFASPPNRAELFGRWKNASFSPARTVLNI